MFQNKKPPVLVFWVLGGGRREGVRINQLADLIISKNSFRTSKEPEVIKI